MEIQTGQTKIGYLIGFLSDLVEHFSSISLTIKNVPQDEFGNAYEYLIKKFADDSGHSAAEFYTNRTVVRLMTLIVDPQPGDSIYDPTCGSGGMLLNARLLVQERGKEYQNTQAVWPRNQHNHIMPLPE